jgi:hypothetical protein
MAPPRGRLTASVRKAPTWHPRRLSWGTASAARTLPCRCRGPGIAAPRVRRAGHPVTWEALARLSPLPLAGWLGQDRSTSRSLRPTRPWLRFGFWRGQRPRLRLGRRDGPRLRLGFRWGRWLRSGCRWWYRRFRPRSGRRPRRRRRVRRPRPWRRVRVRDPRWFRWFGPGRFRRYWLQRDGIAGCFAGGRCGRAGGLSWHLEMIPRRVPATRRRGGCAWPHRLDRWPGVAHWCHAD